ncbi:hypothetical protein I4U23_001450 [Adineta vaga]|nr:hypothetical protein I4U23_001450 [Adineta vaga]
MSHLLFVGEDHTAKYRLHRPNYPKALFEQITNYYFNGKATNEKIPLALDVGCGSGQATVDLSLFCERVIGIDVSADQIANAIPKDNIEYRHHTAEDLSFLQSNSVDLITIAATLHWLDIDNFFKEVKRILKPQTGVIAIWLYKFGMLDNPKADAVYHEFHHGLLLPYWSEKLRIIENDYESILPRFPYPSTLCQQTIEFKMETTITQLLGFLESTSPCQSYRKQNGEQLYQDTLHTLRQKLTDSYGTIESQNDQSIETENFDSLKIILSRPICLYLMKKNEI